MSEILNRYSSEELVTRFRKIFDILEIDFSSSSDLGYVSYLKFQSTAEVCLLFFALTLYYPRESEFEDFQYALNNEDESTVVKRYFWSNTSAEFSRPESKSLCDVTETSRAPYNTGIQRVTRKIFTNRPVGVQGFAWDRERFAPKSLTHGENENLLHWGSVQKLRAVVRIGKMQYKKTFITSLVAYAVKFPKTKVIYHFFRIVFKVDPYEILSRYFKLVINNHYFLFYDVRVFTTELFYLDQSIISIYINLLKSKSIRMTALVHDSIPVAFPQYVASPTIAGYMHILRLYSYVDQLFVPTLSERENVIKALSLHDNCTQNIGILPLSGDSFVEDQMISTNFGNAEVRILILGSLDPRKNQVQMLRAVKELRLKISNKIIVNIVAGGEWMSDGIRSELAGLNKIGIDCSVSTSISDEELYKILRNSSFLFFMSHAEGFGLPIAEAGFYDLPVITSNLGAMKEVASLYCPRYLLAEPTRIDLMTDSLLAAMNDKWSVGPAPLRHRSWKNVTSDFYFEANLPEDKSDTEE